MPNGRSSLFAWAALVATALSGVGAITPSIPGGHWVDTWVSMPQLTESTNLPPPPFNGTTGIFMNSTLRQTIHTSVGGKQIRLRISNNFGDSNLEITSAGVGLPSGGASGVSAIQKGTAMPLTFSGNKSILIPNGALAVSDPIDFEVKPQSELAIDLFLAGGQGGFNITSHPGSRATTWFTFGNQVGAANITGPEVMNTQHWYFISAVEVWAEPSVKSFAIIGDSITDGRESTTDGNNRWPDELLARMQQNKATSNIAVLNQAAGGNRILADGLGPAAQGRVERDVLAHPNVGFAMIFEGVNDIGTAPFTATAQATVVQQLIEAYKQMITRVHTNGIPMFAGTITPFGSPSNVNGSTVIQAYDDPLSEASRQTINQWIRTSGAFDGVVDFDAVVRDPKNHSKLAPEFDSGDGLHPTPAGYEAMGAAIPLSWFTDFAHGVSGFQ